MTAPGSSPQSSAAENRASGTAARAASTNARHHPGPVVSAASVALSKVIEAPASAAAVNAATAWV
jgi:hypothetical protein